ncbi:MAG: jacalin-like lectin [Marinoscillum sp.]
MKKLLVFLSLVSIMLGCDQLNDPRPELADAASEVNGINSSNSFSVLTYNVAGLPGFLSSGDPEANTATIGGLVNDYDIVHVQEDFNYHATLYANDNHPHRTPTSGGVPFGDGLNAMSNFTYTDFQRIKWNDCNGTDCLTPKGFTVARYRIAPGVYIDFYNAHPNASVGEADLAARRSNILQLKSFISTFSAGNAVVVMGDMNCRYTRSGDNIRELPSLGLTDVWVELIKNGVAPAIGSPALVCDNNVQYGDPQCEIVDKVFYRGNNFINLAATTFSYEESKFRDENGDMLSDHRPIYVQFDWSLAEDLMLSDQFGGPHGFSFSDVNEVPENPVVQKLFLRAGSRLDQVGVVLSNGPTLSHGGNGGTYQELTLNPGEYFNEVQFCQGKKDGHTRIFRAEFKTNQNRTLAGGNHTNDNITFIAPVGWQIVGFHGRSGSEVDKLGVIYAPVN